MVQFLMFTILYTWVSLLTPSLHLLTCKMGIIIIPTLYDCMERASIPLALKKWLFSS